MHMWWFLLITYHFKSFYTAAVALNNAWKYINPSVILKFTTSSQDTAVSTFVKTKEIPSYIFLDLPTSWKPIYKSEPER